MNNLLETSLLLIQDSDVSNNKPNPHKTLRECIPYRIVAVVEFNGDPMVRLKNSIELLKACLHEILIIAELLLLDIIDDCLILVRGHRSEPRFPHGA